MVQRGHSRQVVFAEDEDYQRYLSDRRNLEDAFDNKLHAFCRMTTHTHLLLAAAGPPFYCSRRTAPQCTSTPETAVSR